MEKNRCFCFLRLVFLGLVWMVASSGAQAAEKDKKAQAPTPTLEDREALPINPPYIAPIKTLDPRDVMPPPLFEVKPPRGPPNVVVILIDDLGFGGTSRFGGPGWS